MSNTNDINRSSRPNDETCATVGEDIDLSAFECGVVSLSTTDPNSKAFWRELKLRANETDLAFITIFFSCTSFSTLRVTDWMEEACPGIDYAACSTAGEITKSGMSEGGIVAMLYPAEHFRMKGFALPHISGHHMDDIVQKVRVEKQAFLGAAPGLDGANKTQTKSQFALCFIDGMSHAEEAVTAALHWGLEEFPLIGGSAGDDLRLADTVLMLNGTIHEDSAIVVLAETAIPFRIFKTDNFIPTDDKLVVTNADPDRRLVYEFNAAPAAQEYARIIGIDPENLSPLSFASSPLVMRVNADYYCRSIQKANEDGSLSFFCAIDNGIVLTVAEQRGMSRTTRQAFDDVSSDLGAIDFVLGFDCILRRIDARNRQVTHKIAAIYQENNVVGFNTYGEQYVSMHLNQTFTGIAFGKVEGDVSQRD